jgi:phage FluMu gp28-like protein
MLEALMLPGALPRSEAEALWAWAGTFYPFQREWLFEPARFAIANKARQVGASHTTGAAGVLWGAFLGETTTVISIGQREAIEVLEKAERHAQVMARLGSRWAAPKRKGEEVRFASGGRIIALPASSGGRGFSGNVFLDEFAYHGNFAERIWDSAAAVAMHGYRVRIASTPNGVGNLFHDLWSNPVANKGYAKHEFLLARAIREGMRVDIEECWKLARGDARVFAQFFEGVFLDGAEQYIPTGFVNAATIGEMPPLAGRRYAGMDIGRHNDLTVLIVVEQAPDGMAYVIDMQECSRTKFAEQQAMVETSAAAYGWERLCVDATGMGAGLVESLQDKLGKMRVEPVTFGTQTKEALATLMYQAFCDGMVKMYRDPLIINDICSIRRTVTSTGAVRYDAPSTSQGHADRAWALALALQACGTAPTRLGAQTLFTTSV